MATPILNITTLSSGQSQKEVTVNDALTILDIGAGALVKSLAGLSGSQTLTVAEGQTGVIILTGAPSAAVTVIIPSSVVRFVFAINLTTGAKTITIQHQGQTGVTLSPGELTPVWPTVSQGQGISNVGRRRSLTATSGTLTLTDEEAHSRSIVVTGSPGTNVNVIVPVAYREYVFFSNLSGGFTITVKTSAGTGVTIANGKRAIVEADGTNVVRITADI